MPNYIAIIHKDPDSCYGVQFPDVPGVFSAGETIDEAASAAPEVLAFAAEDWEALQGQPFPHPRTIDQLRDDPAFRDAAADGLLLIVPFDPRPHRLAAE